MTNLRNAAEKLLAEAEKIETYHPEFADAMQDVRRELGIPQETAWQFKIVGFRNVTLPNGRDELQFSIADADAPKGWS